MSLFRRGEPSHVRLAREGGLSLSDEPARPAWDAAGIHGLQRPRQWDLVTTVEAPELPGDRADFVGLGNGTVVVTAGPEHPDPLARAIERELGGAYRAEAVKRDGGLWAVGARRIELAEVPGLDGDEIEVASGRDERSVVIDGDRVFGSLPQLEQPGHVVRARRIQGDLWELERAPL